MPIGICSIVEWSSTLSLVEENSYLAIGFLNVFFVYLNVYSP